MEQVRINSLLNNYKIDDPKCQVLINFYSDEKIKTSIPKHSQKHLIKDEKVDFKNDTINIDSLDSSKGILKIFININGKKIESNNENELNYYTIKLKDIEIKDEFQDLNIIVVNNIEVQLSLKVKNIIGGGFASRMNMFKKKSDSIDSSSTIISTGAGIKIKDRLKFLNKMGQPPVQEPKDRPVPKKIKFSSELTNRLNHNFGGSISTNKSNNNDNTIQKKEEKKIENKKENTIEEKKEEPNIEQEKKEEKKEEKGECNEDLETNKIKAEVQNNKNIEEETKKDNEKEKQKEKTEEKKEENKEEIKEEKEENKGEKQEEKTEEKKEEIEEGNQEENNEEKKEEQVKGQEEENIQENIEEQKEGELKENLDEDKKEDNLQVEKVEEELKENNDEEIEQKEEEKTEEEMKQEENQEEENKNKENEQSIQNQEEWGDNPQEQIEDNPHENEKVDENEKGQNAEENNENMEEKQQEQEEKKSIDEKVCDDEEQNKENEEEKDKAKEEEELNKYNEKEEEKEEIKDQNNENDNEEEQPNPNQQEEEEKPKEEEVVLAQEEEIKIEELKEEKENKEDSEEKESKEEQGDKNEEENNSNMNEERESTFEGKENKNGGNLYIIEEGNEDQNGQNINEEFNIEEKQDTRSGRNDYFLKRSLCLRQSTVNRIEKEKEEEKQKKKMDPKRGSCMIPPSNLIINMEKSKLESNNQQKKNVPKKLDANKFKLLIGRKIMGQSLKLPNLIKKKEESETFEELQNPNNSRSQTTPEIIPIQQEIKGESFRTSKLLKQGTVNLEQEMLKFNEKMKVEKKKKNTKSPQKKLNKRKSENDFGFEVLESFNDDFIQNTTANTSNDTNYTEEFLDSMNYSDYLSDLKKQGIKESNRETFCEGFFIASFPKKKGNVIENSAQKLPASCGHNDCTQLPSMKPEIIMRYPLKDTKNLELNNLAATICFPTGIKLCYSENDYPEKIKDYVTQITNQKGERYYMRTFHFYHKMQNIEFTKEYEIHPLKHHLMKFTDEYAVLSEDKLTDNIIESIQKNLDFCQELGFRDIVYIPYCICLISKYSYTKELEVCLNTLYRIMAQEPNKLNFEINELIMYLIHSIPIPINNMRIKFYIPYTNSKLELLCPKVDDVSTMNSTFTKLFDYLSIDNITLIFRLLLSEKKILFIHDNYTELTNFTDSFISLLYPFKWVHTYIPIMSDQMLKYLQTFLPFLNGIHESLMKFVEDVFNEGELEDSDEVFLVYIKRDEITLSSSLKKSKVKFSKYVQNNVLPLPFESKLKKELKIIQSLKKESKKESKNQIDPVLETRMRDAFIDIFVRMFEDYEKYVGILDDDVVFNKVLFMNTVSKDQKFYDEFIDCQLFQQFTQSLLKQGCSYFNNKIKERKEKNKEKEKKRKSKKNDKGSNSSARVSINKQETVYLLRPDYLGVKENDKNLIESTLKNYKSVSNESDEIKNFILEKINPIDPEKYIDSNCTIYLTPDKKDSNKEDEDNKNKLQELDRDSTPFLKKKTNTLLSGGQLTEKQIDTVKEDIKEMVIKIYKSQIGSDTKTLKTEALRNLETSYGRSFFVSLISNNNNNIIFLQENSFKFLEEIIHQIFITISKLEETEQILEEIVIIIKSTEYFQMETKKEKGSKSHHDKKEKVTLFTILKKKIQNFKIILEKSFWLKWVEYELKKKENNNDDFKSNLVVKTCEEMLELEIYKATVKNICDTINKSLFGESDNFVLTQKEYISLIAKSQYISKVKKYF